MTAHRRTCVACEKPKKTQHEHCKACERELFPGVDALRQIMANTRIPCACGTVASHIVNFRPVCTACKNQLRATDCNHRKDWKEKRGICRDCQNPAAKGRKHCTACLESARLRARLWISSGNILEKKAQRAQVARDMRARRAEAGVCINCANKRAEGRSRCLPCLEKNHAYQAEKFRLGLVVRKPRIGPTMEDLYGGREDFVAPNGDFAAGVDFDSLASMNHNYVPKL